MYWANDNISNISISLQYGEIQFENVAMLWLQLVVRLQTTMCIGVHCVSKEKGWKGTEVTEHQTTSCCKKQILWTIAITTRSLVQLCHSACDHNSSLPALPSLSSAKELGNATMNCDTFRNWAGLILTRPDYFLYVYIFVLVRCLSVPRPIFLKTQLITLLLRVKFRHTRSKNCHWGK